MLHEPLYRHFATALISAATIGLLAWLGRRAKAGQNGWKRIRPSPMHWFGLTIAAGLLAIMTYVRLFVGSSRADAAEQMQILTILIMVLAAGFIFMARSTFHLWRLGLAWRENQLAFRGQSGKQVIQNIQDIKSRDRTPSGGLIFRFFDGELLRLDENAAGVPELITAIDGSVDVVKSESDR